MPRLSDAQEAAAAAIGSKVAAELYGLKVICENIEDIAVPSIQPSDNHIVILDEIGKMECFSERFREAALHALDSDNVVAGTITFGGDDFIMSIKRRDDIEITEVTRANRDILPDILLKRISHLLERGG